MGKQNSWWCLNLTHGGPNVEEMGKQRVEGGENSVVKGGRKDAKQ